MPADLPPLPISLPNLTTTQLTAILVPLVATIPLILYNTFPPPPKVYIRPSLSSSQGLESAAKARLRQLYPEDVYQGGSYANLPLGKLKYWIVGPEDGTKVVLINGIGMPAPVWKDVVPYLTKAGFRVLLFDHYGRGYSEAPDVQYTDTFYITQLALLLQHLSWQKAHFVGLSMGGGVLAAFAAAFPQIASDKLAFIAPAGIMKDEDLPSIFKLAFSPLGQYITSIPGVKAFLGARLATAPTNSSPVGKLEEMVRLQQIELPGYIPALASSFRDGPLRGQEASWSAIGARPSCKTLLIWGANDPSVPYKLNDEIRRRAPQTKLVTIQNGGHELTVTHSETVGTALVDFFNAN